MRLKSIQKGVKYSLGDKGMIYIDEKYFLHFSLDTKTLIEILPKFLEKLDKDIEYIYYKGDNAYLKNNFVYQEDLVVIYLRPYRAFVKSEFMELETYKEIFSSRGNWLLEEDKDLEYELYYAQGGKYLRDKSLWDIKAFLSNRPNRQKLDITEKDKHYRLVSPELRESFLLPQYRFTLSPKFNPDNLKSFILKNGVTILKPTDGFGGKSIYVIKDFDSFLRVIKDLKKIKKKDHWSTKKTRKNEGITGLYWVLEKYIDNPHLYKGKKYHFRIYYIIDRDGEAYIYNKFRIAHALKNYVKDNYTDQDIHDTHFIKRVKDEFIFLNDFLKAKDYKETVEAVKILFNNISKHLKVFCYDNNIKCFQIFACDLMLDSDLNLKLIELNTNPGFNPTLKMAEEVLENCMYHIVDKYYPPKNSQKDPGNFIQVYENKERKNNPRGLFGQTILNQKDYIEKVAKSWHTEGYGPKPTKDRTGGFYLSCVENLNREKDFHIHLVGPEGKYHPNAWSRKVKERRRWEKIEFNITPKEMAFRIYVKSGYREIPACLNYNKSRRN